jgi:hypothetical protein
MFSDRFHTDFHLVGRRSPELGIVLDLTEFYGIVGDNGSMSTRGSFLLDQISAQDEAELRRRQAVRDYTVKPHIGLGAWSDAEMEKLRTQLLQCLRRR